MLEWAVQVSRKNHWIAYDYFGQKRWVECEHHGVLTAYFFLQNCLAFLLISGMRVLLMRLMR